MPKRLVWWLSRLGARNGVILAIGLLLAIAASMVGHWYTLPTERETHQLKNQARSLERESRSAATQNAAARRSPPPDFGAASRELETLLASAPGVEDVQRDLAATAFAQGLRVSRGDYSHASRTSHGLVSVDLTYPAEGSEKQLFAWISGALAKYPTLQMTSMEVERAAQGVSPLKVKVVLRYTRIIGA